VQLVGCAVFLLILGCAVGLWCWGGQQQGAGAEGATTEDERPAVEAPGKGKSKGRGKR
jgi:hypothetical protein